MRIKTKRVEPWSLSDKNMKISGKVMVNPLYFSAKKKLFRRGTASRFKIG